DVYLAYDIESLEARGHEAVERSGAALFEALIRGKVRSLYDQGRGSRGSDPARGLRIRIDIDARDERVRPLVCLPWEILFDRAADANRFVALDSRRPVVRTIDSSEPPLAPAEDPLKRVLLASAGPNGADPVEFDHECARVETALQRHRVRPT